VIGTLSTSSPSNLPVLPGLSATTYQTSRLRIHALSCGPRKTTTAVFLHGNASAARFWEETMLGLPTDIRALAPDLRGYGRTEAKPIDATRGLRDFSDDLHAFLQETGNLAGGKPHLVGWSAGAAIAMQYAIDHAANIGTLTLIAPMSPFGFGGTKDEAGTPCAPDFAGSGGGTAAAEFVARIRAGDTSEDSDFSPRKVMNQYYFKPPFRVPRAREDVFVAEILSSSTEPGCYPGDMVTSPSWPGIAPGKLGMNNAISPAYCNLSAFAKIDPKPPVLWIRGADDQIVSDTSLFDLGYLGKLGAVPGWPGDDVYPPQPMIRQTRAVLEAYQAAGGSYREIVLPDVGHAPHIEAPEKFRAELIEFMRRAWK
jgi:pimeloyl-ACP methyl ester carboxylesterase